MAKMTRKEKLKQAGLVLWIGVSGAAAHVWWTILALVMIWRV